MWMSEEAAYAMVRDLSASVDAAREVADARTAVRDRVLAMLYPQGDIVTQRLAEAAGVTPGRIRQIAAAHLDASVFDTTVLDDVVPLIEHPAGSDVITPDQRVHVA